MKNLSQILNEMAKVDDILKKIADDMKYSFKPPGMNKYSMGDDVQGPEINVERREVWIDIRNLGHWVVPSDARGNTEDYDWKVWAPGEHQKYQKYFKDYIKSKSWANLVKEFRIDGSEKSWVMFRIFLKNRLFIKQPGAVASKPEPGMDWDRKY